MTAILFRAAAARNRSRPQEDEGLAMPEWNQFPTEEVPTITTSRVMHVGHNGDVINAYYARPTGEGPYPGIVLVHHVLGWDEYHLELARRFAHHGFATISPNLFTRNGPGTPDDVAARARGAGGIPDEQVVGDSVGALDFLKSQDYANGKVGIIGPCSGGRHAYLVAASSGAFDAVAALWPGDVVQANLTPNMPVSPHTMTADLNCAVIGIFGNDDRNPSPAMANQLEEELQRHGKRYEFHRYDGAGHGMWYYHNPLYRQMQAMDSLSKVLNFFAAELA
jgi:carboxymethylenebutenolidase